MLELYTDGACINNPGPGGWGVLIINGSSENSELSGFVPQTTNNQMELQAALQAMLWMKAHNHQQAIIFTDSQYVLLGITQWMKNWKRNAWMTAGKSPVKNKELWQELDQASTGLSVEWRWVKGHSGDPHNDRVDVIARQQALSGGK